MISVLSDSGFDQVLVQKLFIVVKVYIMYKKQGSRFDKVVTIENVVNDCAYTIR